MSAPLITAYLNGRFLPLAEASVPVLDRGFLFGDGVYEVVPAYGGRMFRLDQHLDRLDRSLEAIRLDDGMDRARWHEVLERLLRENGGGDIAIYMQVTRGADTGRDHGFPGESVRPTVFCMCSPLAGLPEGAATEGVACILMEDLRWRRCDIKATSLLANVLHRQAAREAGAAEALLVRDGEVTEGSASSLFLMADGRVATPPKGPSILPGITRDLLIELLVADGMPVDERRITTEELRSADEVWITSSNREVVPVTHLDGEAVGAGRPGSGWRRAWDLFQDFKARFAAGGSEDT